jgi:parallel beta-helix repeat protein
MRTLDQVEPRQLLTNAPVTISQAGSYYLANNLSGTVTIAANNVSLDLMGFSIVAPAGDAVTQSGSRTNLLVRNGILTAPFGDGVDFNLSPSAAGANGVIEDLRITGCGAQGIVVASGFTVRRCHISDAIVAGLRVTGNSEILENTVTRCGIGLYVSGAGARVDGNVVKGNTDNYNFTPLNQLNLLLSEVPESLDWPCSVKLAGSLRCSVANSNGISVNADNVTIDMAGHTLTGPGANSGTGIYAGDHSIQNLRVFNGQIVNWNGSGKAGLNSYSGVNALIVDIQSLSNSAGFVIGGASVLQNCHANYNVGYGINATSFNTLRNCNAIVNGDTGINLTGFGNILHDNVVHYNGRHGIFADGQNSLQNCVASRNGEVGIYVGRGNKLQNCTAYFNLADGILIASDNVLQNCRSSMNGFVIEGSISGGAGIHVIGLDNVLEGNAVKDNDWGIKVDSGNNFMARNTSSNNGTNWVISAGNACLVVNATLSGAISGNSGGVSPGSADPNANFTH